MKNEKQTPALRFRGFDGPWEKKKLGDIGTAFDYGLNASATDYDGKHKYLRITDIDDESRKFVIDNLTSPDIDFADSDEYKLNEGDMVFARTGASVGKTYLYSPLDGDVYYAGYLIRAHIKQEYDSNFVFQSTLTSSYARYIAITSQRSGQPGVNAQEYAAYEMYVPTLDEQQHVGNTLHEIDELIDWQEQKIKKAEQFRRAMLSKLFPAEGASEPALRFRGFSGPWKIVQIYDIANIVGGGTPDTQEPAFWNGDIDWYAPVEMEGKRYADGSERKITALGLEKSGAQLLPANRTILFTSRAGIGKMAVLRKEGATNQGFQSMVLKDTCAPYFIYAMGPFITRMAEQVAAGSTFLEISGKALGNLFVSIPSLEEQKKIGDFFEHLDDFLSLQREKREKLRRLKAALLEKLFV